MPAGTITSLVVQTHDKTRVNVFVDGAFAIGVTLATLQREGLYKGKVLDGLAWSRLERAEADEQAWQAALRLLEVRPRTEHEIRDRLRRKEYVPEQIEGVVVRLRELGFIDDGSFAKQWIENRAAFKPKGGQALRQELMRKGVNREVAARVIAESTSPELEAEQCMQIARQVVRRYSSAPDKLTFQRKLGAFLQRRGYRFDTFKPVLQTLWAELHAANEMDEEEEML
jgi:regulatory protein